MKNQFTFYVFLLLGFISKAQNHSIELTLGSSYFLGERIFKQDLSSYLAADFDKTNLIYGLSIYDLNDRDKDSRYVSEYGFYYYHPVLMKANGFEIKYLGYRYSFASGLDLFKKNKNIDFILMGG